MFQFFGWMTVCVGSGLVLFSFGPTAGDTPWRWVKIHRHRWEWSSGRRGGLRPGKVWKGIGVWRAEINEPDPKSESEVFTAEAHAKAWVEQRYAKILSQ